MRIVAIAVLLSSTLDLAAATSYVATADVEQKFTDRFGATSRRTWSDDGTVLRTLELPPLSI